MTGEHDIGGSNPTETLVRGQKSGIGGCRQRCPSIPSEGWGWNRGLRAEPAVSKMPRMSTILNRLVNSMRGGLGSTGLLGVLAVSNSGELRRQIRYLKLENDVLRSRIAGPVRVTPAERSRLVKLAKPVGRAVGRLVSIVKPDTMLRWVNGSRPKKQRRLPRKPGRPRTPERVRALVLRIARENAWGSTRIMGEMKKLGIKVGRGTVVNILKEAGVPTAPQRGESTWDQFMQSHVGTLWACDFLSQRVVTGKGIVEAFVLVFINVVTRRAYATTSTKSPTEEWTAAEGVRFVEAAKRSGGGARPCAIIIRDRDSKYGKTFDAVLKQVGVTRVPLPHCSPNLNAHVERLIQSIQVECLDRFIVLGTGHLDHLVAEYIEHYNTERPHSGIEHRTPVGRAPPMAIAQILPSVRCRKRIGGVLRHQFQSAAWLGNYATASRNTRSADGTMRP